MSDTLFSQSYLESGLPETDEYQQIGRSQLSHFGQDLRRSYRAFTNLYDSSNEAQVEDALIRPVLNTLGWSYLPQPAIPGLGQIPDYTLFLDDASRTAFTGNPDFHYVAALAEAKAWGVHLDRRAGPRTPGSQVQDYLRRFWQATGGRAKWGILTNGETWRLYRATGAGPDGKFHQTQDVWLEITLSECIADAGQEARRRFLLFFHRDAFRIDADGYCFLDRALAGAADYAQTVTETLQAAVFETAYPQLLAAFYQAAPEADPDDIQESALTLLYRLLFLMYAEDRRLLPTAHPAYATISLRRLRQDILARMQRRPVFLRTYTYWPVLQELFQRIDCGEPAAGLPAYNGGLFNPERPELLARIRLPDASIAEIIHNLGAAAVNGAPDKVLVNFRDLSVRQLGTLYERLLERRPVIHAGSVTAQLQPHARKDTGSYYTPPELVRLIVAQALEPLVNERAAAFQQLAQSLASDTRPDAARRQELENADPAEACLRLKVLDPAMGSGHFLVAALDYLTDAVDRLAGDAAELAPGLPQDAPYASPLLARVANIRAELSRQAAAGAWEMPPENLTDRAIIRRLVLKRCIYGVDLNPMAVELSKMSLWLHSFTVGAPLTYLEHHLRCGDSLVGGWLAQSAADLEAAAEAGGRFASFIAGRMTADAYSIQRIEQIDDSDVSEVSESESRFNRMLREQQPLRNLLDFFAALRWLAAGQSDRPLALRQPALLGRQIGDDRAAAVAWWLAQNYELRLTLLQLGPDAVSEAHRAAPQFDFAGLAQFIRLWREIRQLVAERRIIHWELHFPGVFHHWQPRSGGFDAVIGNPPWDRVKLQEVEWFAPATRRPPIAHATPASRRQAMVARLETDADPLYADYAAALTQADTMLQYGRACGDYPLLGGGDTNLYRLFVERAQSLTDERGIYALLTPSGIYGDRSAADYFGGVSGNGRLLALYDFENRRGPDRSRFFPEVHPQFKFCAMITGGAERTADEVPCAFLLPDHPDDVSPERLITMRAADFALVNPNTGTAPIFLNRRDADIVLDIYRNHPVFGDSAAGVARHLALAHMTNDSRHFRTREQLESDGWYPVDLNRWRRGNEVMLPLYQGRMIYHFDHRYNAVEVNPANVHNPYVNAPVTDAQRRNTRFYPQPQYWVPQDLVQSKFPNSPGYAVGFRLTTNATNERTLIATIVPWAGYANSLPLLVCNGADAIEAFTNAAPLWTANFCSFAFDFVARRKVQGSAINWYILQQLPVITRAAYDRRFGDRTAADLVRDHTLRLSYTAYDLQPFAQAQSALLGRSDSPPSAPAQGYDAATATATAAATPDTASAPAQGYDAAAAATPQTATTTPQGYDATAAATPQTAATPAQGYDAAAATPQTAFAPAQGYDGEPFAWNVAERRHLRARLDALYFILYGISRDDAAYIMDSFPITRSNDAREHNGRYLTKDLILGYMNALAAGDTESTITPPG